MAAREEFDLVLMDCQMPEMDGYEATRRLRAAGFAAPIVAMTANAIKGDRERCIEAGMNDYLTKPMDLKLLRGMLARWGGGVPSRLADLPLFDADAMQSRFGGDLELEEVALSTFQQATPNLLLKLRAALEAGDRQAFERHAHSAKGSSAMISAERCAALGALMEERAPAAPLEDLRQLLEEFQRAFDAFLEVLRGR
jgi:CheY-like chemotaxis protein